MRSLVATLAVLAAVSPAGAKTRHKHRAAHATHERVRTHAFQPLPALRGQSIGAPWAGHLRNPAELAPGHGYVIRRPWRAFGTRTTVDLVHHAIVDIRDRFPNVHVLAIGDLSQRTGGEISQHHSHQSGRDADIGLFYNEKPRGYPENFVRATEDNLDCAATYALLDNFVATKHVQMIFLDYDVQGILYRWALDHGVSEAHLDRLFQYPHGRGSGDGIVRHWPNHDNHMHVRFGCQDQDDSCH